MGRRPINIAGSTTNRSSSIFRVADLNATSERTTAIVMLKDLFLAEVASLVQDSERLSENHAAHVKSLHKVDLRDPVVTEKDQAVCLAPISSEMLKHFPELFRDIDRIEGAFRVSKARRSSGPFQSKGGR